MSSPWLLHHYHRACRACWRMHFIPCSHKGRCTPVPRHFPQWKLASPCPQQVFLSTYLGPLQQSLLLAALAICPPPLGLCLPALHTVWLLPILSGITTGHSRDGRDMRLKLHAEIANFYREQFPLHSFWEVVAGADWQNLDATQLNIQQLLMSPVA